MLEITAFEKASKSITSSAAETKNICLVEHESRILAQRPFHQTIVWVFLILIEMWSSNHWAALNTTYDTTQNGSFAWKSHLCPQIFMVF